MAAQYRAVAYFVNWAIYARNYNPQDLPADKLTHVLYSFANVKSDTGEVFLTDTWSDTDKHYPDDSWNDPGTNLYGCLKQLGLLKRANRKLKVLLSVGGWTYSSNFAAPMATAAGRDMFASSAVALLANLGLDGIDIDWEYPADAGQAANYVQLLAACRAALDAYADRTGTPRTALLLTVACPAGASNYEKLQLRDMDQYLDFWNLMAYDYAGSWDTVAGHQANVSPSKSAPAATPFSTEAAVDYYIQAGVPAAKIVMGCPLYGRAFQNTTGPGQSFSGVGEGSWENGVWDWKALPRPGAAVLTDADACASWCFDGGANPGTMVSYDTLDVGVKKADWVRQRQLGGAMWWESSGDRAGADSMIAHVVTELGSLEQSQNTLSYPETKYDNLRNGFA